jgi:hypothetical protein
MICVLTFSVKALQAPTASSMQPTDGQEVSEATKSSNLQVHITADNIGDTVPEQNTAAALAPETSPAANTTELTVNGQDVPIPKNGTVITKLDTDSTQTTVTVQASSSSTGESTSKSKLRIKSSTRSTESVTNHSTSQITEEGELLP